HRARKLCAGYIIAVLSVPCFASLSVHLGILIEPGLNPSEHLIERVVDDVSLLIAPGSKSVPALQRFHDHLGIPCNRVACLSKLVYCTFYTTHRISRTHLLKSRNLRDLRSGRRLVILVWWWVLLTTLACLANLLLNLTYL